jgi:hypothetical protein
VSNNILFANSQCNGIFRSTDSGISWTAIDSGINVECFQNLFAEGDTLYGMTDPPNIFRSTNNGDIWEMIDSALPNTVSQYSLIDISGKNIAVEEPTNPDTALYFLFSSDGGDSWSQPANPDLISGYSWNAIFIKDTTIFFAERNRLYRSRGFSFNWELLPGDTETFWAFASKGNAIFGAAQDEGVFMSTDDGDTWIEESDGLDGILNNRVQSLVVVGNTLYAATDSGTYMADISAFSSVSQTPLIESTSAIIVTPNPAPGTAWLKVNSDANHFEITVSDPLGRVIALPISIEMRDAQEQLIPIDLRESPPGVYFVRVLFSTGEIRTSKFVME